MKANLAGTVALRVRAAVNSFILLDGDRASLLPPHPGRAVFAHETVEEFQAVECPPRRAGSCCWRGGVPGESHPPLALSHSGKIRPPLQTSSSPGAMMLLVAAIGGVGYRACPGHHDVPPTPAGQGVGPAGTGARQASAPAEGRTREPSRRGRQFGTNFDKPSLQMRYVAGSLRVTAPREWRQVGSGACSRVLQQGSDQGVVSVLRSQVRVDPLDHGQRRMADDLSHLDRIDPPTQGPGHEAVPEQVGMHGLAESGAPAKVTDDLADGVGVERLIGARPTVAAETEEDPVWVTGVLGGTGAFDVPLEATGQLRSDRHVTVPVPFAANQEERTAGANQEERTAGANQEVVAVQADQFADPNARIGQNPHQQAVALSRSQLLKTLDVSPLQNQGQVLGPGGKEGGGPVRDWLSFLAPPAQTLIDRPEVAVHGVAGERSPALNPLGIKELGGEGLQRSRRHRLEPGQAGSSGPGQKHASERIGVGGLHGLGGQSPGTARA